MNKKGTIVCQVKVNKPSVDKIFWEYQNGKTLVDASMNPPKGSKGTFSLPLDITYDEWSKGIKLDCIVEHADWVEPLKKPYEREIGKKNIQLLCTTSLCLIPLVIPSDT